MACFQAQSWQLFHTTQRSTIMGRSADDHHSCSSSVDSSSHLPSSSSSCDSCFDEGIKIGHAKYGSGRLDLSTDLKLGLALPLSLDDDPHIRNSSSLASASTQREKVSDWPPIKPLLRSTLAGKSHHSDRASLFVKVYMEGIPIGRKLDLYAFEGYDALLATLCRMFKTTILCPEDADCVHSGQHNVLTYEDMEGDWMMVGDIPWEMFLSSVKRLKITRADRC